MGLGDSHVGQKSTDPDWPDQEGRQGWKEVKIDMTDPSDSLTLRDAARDTSSA